MNSLGNPKLPHCKIDRSRRDLTVLICGHMSRDSRCGTLAPILKAEFERHLPQLRHAIRDKFPNRFAQHHREQIAVGSCSHIGGHAFAGNVVIYFPKRTWVKGWESGLAGKGIWYGRVEPRHVAGIIEQTILQGKIIQELLRGVHDPAGA